MKTIEQLKKYKNELLNHKSELSRKISWAQYALNAPADFTTPVITALRQTVLEALMEEQIICEQAIKKIENQIFEAETLQSCLVTKRIMKAMGVPHRSEKGVFYLLP